MGEKLDNFERAIPAYINLSHTLVTYNVIAELNQAHDRKSQLPAANQRAPPRQIGAAGAPPAPAAPARPAPQPPAGAARQPPPGGAGRAPPGRAPPNRMDQKFQ
ncbi:hypothetical protein FGO68_gene13174 [Halteria grandinella]|uniref:Uncharacterized protein n=1 Tax=Halteria grandinella TaxID=5974 RepID=A0A8J8NHA9_HALGN|nr:hypothetical protein FGO68_gene13174 [Halteria grandinella]